MNVRNITTAISSLILVMVLSTGCRHHKEVVYVNNTPPPTTVVYNNTPPPPNTVVYNNTPPPPQAIAPVVGISYPATNFTSLASYITIRGNIQNIQSANQISVSQNGYPVRFFAYDPYTGNFHFQTFLQQGTNNLIVTANNPYGTGSQGLTVFFNPQPNNGGTAYYPNGGSGYNQNNTFNPNANVAPNGGGNYYQNNNTFNPNANIAPNGGGNNQNTFNPNANVAPNGGNNQNTFNPNANIAPNGGNNINNYNPNGGINPINNGSPNGGGINPNNNMTPIGGGTQYQNNPVVQFIIPSTSPIDVTTPNYNVTANVFNITNQNQITVSVNGTNLPNFNFNPSTHSLTFMASNLLTGFNSIHISATNASGRTASQSTVIDYKTGVSGPPRIQVFNPATSPFSSLQPNMIVSGYVHNVTSSSEITATFNGSPISFNYNNNTQEIDVPVNLTGSSNQLVINANNPAGSTSSQVSLVLINNNPRNVPQNPSILPGNNTNVNNNPHTINQNPNIQTGNNTQPTGNNNNNVNNNPHTINQNPNIQSGNNTQPTGNNNDPHTINQNPNFQAGSVTYIDQHNNSNSGGGTGATGSIGMHNKPEITRTSPGSSPYTTMSGVITAGANVNYVTNASEVSVTYDGSSVSFSYNPQASEALNFTSPLRPGMNTFVIKATNSAGTTSQNIDVNYVPTNTSSNVNGNPNVHFEGGTNVASNTPRGFTPPANNQKVVEPVKNNAKPVVKPK